MKEKLIILIFVILITNLISSTPIIAEDIKIIRKTSGKSYKLQELKTNFLKTESKKISVTAVTSVSSPMSKGTATLLGTGIGFVGGAVMGGIVGSPGSPIDGGHLLGTGTGILIGGLSGLAVGGLIGYIFGG